MAIQLRRGTIAQWESNKSNIVVGEPAVATDTEELFIGTGEGTYFEVLNADAIADEYNTTSSYSVGDVVRYQGKLYKCNTDTSGAWVAANWDETTVNSLIDNSIGDGEITTAKLADSAVNTAKLASNAVTSVKIANGAVTSEKIGEGSVQTANIYGGAVTSAKLANGAVETAKIADSSVTPAKLNGVIDSTLATSGKAADAKATGDAIADVNNALSDSFENFYKIITIKPELNIVGYVSSNGTFNASELAKRTDFIPIEKCNHILYRANIPSGGCEVAFYDGSKSFISSISIIGRESSAVRSLTLDSNYASAKYAIFSAYGVTAITNFFAELRQYKNIEDKVSDNDTTQKSIIHSLTDYSLKYECGKIGYINSSGVINLSDDARNTGLIPIDDANKIEYYTEISSSAYEIAFFDENKNILSDISVYGDGSLSAESVNLLSEAYKNAKYCCVSVYGSSLFSRAYLKIEKNNTINIPLSNNGYCRYADGNIVDTSSSSSANTGILRKMDYDWIVYRSVIASAGCEIAFFDKNKTYLQSLSVAGAEHNWEHIINLNDPLYSNVYYFVVSTYGYFSTSYCVLHKCKNTPTKNKKVLIFGDSVTETARFVDDTYISGTRENWVTFAKYALDTINIKNYAKTGATYKDWSGGESRQTAYEQVTMAISDSTNDDADIVIVSLGTNDGGTSIGSFSEAMSKSIDSLDRHYLYDAIRWVMYTLRNKYTDAQFFVGLPIQRARAEQPDDLIEAITNMGHRYDFIVIDGLNKSGIVRDFEVQGSAGRFLEDGLHPNTAGSKKISLLYSSEILNSLNAYNDIY